VLGNGDEHTVVSGPGEIGLPPGAWYDYDNKYLKDVATLQIPADLPDELVLVRVGTLSKTLGSLGGFVAGSRDLCDLLVNRARPYIFTTAPSPADTAAAAAALEVLRGPEGEALVRRLRDLVARLRPGHPSPIVPVIVGSEADTLALSAALLDRGLLVPAIRPPTVAPGTSRLRIALSAAHTDAQIAALEAALDDLHPAWRSASGCGT